MSQVDGYKIFSFAELAFKSCMSSKYLTGILLKQNGFTIEMGVFRNPNRDGLRTLKNG